MRKNKIFQVDTQSFKAMTVGENDVFYSNDTDAYLTFTVSDTDFEFDRALLYLTNIDDGSVITEIETVILGQSNVEYEIPSEIMAHYGRWKGQIVFEKDGEKASSAIFEFSINRFLTDERPPTLTEIVSLEKLRNDARELIDEVGDLITTNQEIEQAEAQRVSAESSRVSAEEQRKIDHANRSAELAGKADKKQENWITPTLLNGTTAHSNGNVGYYKDDFGIVHLRGRLVTTTDRVILFYLPIKYRPAQDMNFPVFDGGLKSNFIEVGKNVGYVLAYNIPGAYLSLDGISFRAEV